MTALTTSDLIRKILDLRHSSFCRKDTRVAKEILLQHCRSKFLGECYKPCKKGTFLKVMQKNLLLATITECVGNSGIKPKHVCSMEAQCL
jgi:hypothetical protein